MAAVTICSDSGALENRVCYCFYFFPIYLPWNDGTGCHDLSFLHMKFQPAFSLSSSTFIKRSFSSSLLSATRVVSSAYQLLIFLLAILTPACYSSSLAFYMMYLVYKLIRVTIYSLYVLFSQNWASPLFHVWFCYFLTCIQVSQEAGRVVWSSHLFKNFPICCDPRSQRL